MFICQLKIPNRAQLEQINLYFTLLHQKQKFFLATFTNTTTTNHITQVSVNYKCICLICQTNDYYYL